MADSLGLTTKAAYIKDPGENATVPIGLKEYPETPGATDLAANDMIPFTNESLSEEIERSIDPALLGGAAAPAGPIVLEKCSGSIGGRLRWRGWERLAMAAMGFEHPDNSPVQLGVEPAYAHLFELDTRLSDEGYIAGERAAFHANDRKVRRGQIGFKKNVTDWVFGSCMLNKLVVTGTPTETTIEFEVIPYDLYLGSYNSANWTLLTGVTSQAVFQQSTVELGARSAAPGALYTIGASKWELVVDNHLKGDDVTTVSAPNIIIPVRDSFRDVTLSIERPRYSTDDSDDVIQAFFANDIELAASIEIIGPQLATSYTHGWKFYLPSIFPETIPATNIDGPGPLTQSWNFRAFRPITTDPFAATKYESIGVIKDSELVALCYNAENVNYLTEY